MPAPTPRANSRRGWIALIVAFAFGVVLAVVDTALKRAPHAGFVSPEAKFTVITADLPRAWAAFERSGPFLSAQHDAPEVYPRLGVWLRRNAFLRWTPLRSYVWLGRPVAISLSDDGGVLSCKPGLPLRIADAIGAVSPTAWRDGFLLIGSSDRALNEVKYHGVRADPPADTNAIRVAWTGDRSGFVDLSFAEDWSLTGFARLPRIESPAAGDTTRRMDMWPGTPALILFTSDQVSVGDLVPNDGIEFPLHADLDRALDELIARLPPGWDTGAESVQFVLETVDMRDVTPVPELAVMLRSSAPFEALATPPGAIPYVWGAVPGWMQPWRGEPVSLYAASSSRLRVFANNEPAMARALDRPLTGRIVTYDARLQADFTQLGAIARALVRTAAEQELLPGYTKDDAELNIVPWLNAAAALGQLELEGQRLDDRLRFTGTLAVLPMESDTP